jgi:Large polyvalent protein associated domain 23
VFYGIDPPWQKAANVFNPSQPLASDGKWEAGGGAKVEKTTFAGEGAKGADTSLLRQAQAALKAGADRDQVWKDTGWYQAKDGIWRFEIDDSHSQLGKDFNEEFHLFNPTKKEVFQTKLGEVLDHPELYAQYPFLKDIKVEVNRTAAGIAAYYSMLKEVQINYDYYLKLNNEQRLATVLHEVQHAIQDREGFSYGPISSGQKGEDEYHQRIGEVESANTETRMRLGPSARASKPPYATAGIDEAKQLLGWPMWARRGGGKPPHPKPPSAKK